MKNDRFFGRIFIFWYGGEPDRLRAWALSEEKIEVGILNPSPVDYLWILFLQVFQIDYETYNRTACYLSYLLTPATVCLAIPLYQQLKLLERKSSGSGPGHRVRVIASMEVFLFWHLPLD